MSDLLDKLYNYKIQLQGRGKTSLATNNRLLNIKFCESITREGLLYKQKERQLLLYTTSQGEKLFIQYPGKETLKKQSKPWDFRPKLLKNNGEYINDLSLGAIWNSIFDSFNNVTNKEKLLRLLATEFYRIAFMIDYITIHKDSKFEIRDININTEEYTQYEIYISTEPILIYQPNHDIVDCLTKEIPMILDISWEAFLAYNDFLAFNEDCKYFYYGENYKEDTDGFTYIAKGIGRINTLLTHINIIGFILGETKFSDILMKASKGGGVAPVSDKELKLILGKYLY
ncbi:MAG: hypothetical protein K0R71_1174 [Bacillales bacterium]|jgi:hypothetical protein|nr:hypothetical protein [Bacillales bacterium]